MDDFGMCTRKEGQKRRDVDEILVGLLFLHYVEFLGRVFSWLLQNLGAVHGDLESPESVLILRTKHWSYHYSIVESTFSKQVIA